MSLGCWALRVVRQAPKKSRNKSGFIIKALSLNIINHLKISYFEKKDRYWVLN
jgi:hypothetical protein